MMMSSVARVKFIKTKVIFRCHTKGLSNQVSPNLDHQIESYPCSNYNTKMGKNEKKEKIFWITIRGLQIGAGFRGYKLGQEGLQIAAALWISNWAKRLQIGAKRFQIRVDIKNRGKRDFMLG